MTEERRFSSQNAFKLVRAVVISFSVGAIILGSIGIVNNGKASDYYLQSYKKECANNKEFIVTDYCGWLLNEGGLEFRQSLTLFSSGLGSLALFFGGVALYKYLFPVKENKK